MNGEGEQNPRDRHKPRQHSMAGTAIPCKPQPRDKLHSECPVPCLGAGEGHEVAAALCHSCACKSVLLLGMEQQVSMQL